MLSFDCWSEGERDTLLKPLATGQPNTRLSSFVCLFAHQLVVPDSLYIARQTTLHIIYVGSLMQCLYAFSAASYIIYVGSLIQRLYAFPYNIRGKFDTALIRIYHAASYTIHVGSLIQRLYAFTAQ